jgi:hypothetical protein
MPPPKKPQLKDLDREDRISMSEALGDTVPSDSRIDTRRSGELSAIDGVPIPPSTITTPDESTAWAEQEILKATPRAVQEVIHAMKRNPDQKIRLQAALQVLDRAGVQKREDRQQNAPVIILTPQVVQNLPWAKEAKSKGLIKDGAVVDGAFTEIANAKKDRP